MATEVILPKLGQTMEEGTIVEWLKGEGEPVQRGDVLFTIESDKATLEVEAPGRGYLRRILVPSGESVPVLAVVALITRTADEDVSGYDALTQPAGVAVHTLPATAPSPSAHSEMATAAAVPKRGRVLASPRARKLAREKSVDLSLVMGTGPNGRIAERDVIAYLESLPKVTPVAQKAAIALGVDVASLIGTGASGRITRADVETAAHAVSGTPPPRAEESVVDSIPLTGLRRVIAERMATSARSTAHVTLATEADATALVEAREQLKANVTDEWGFAPGYNDLLAIIVARALREYPYMNARLAVDGQTIERLSGVNLGMAVDTERGLLVPVIRNADQKGLRAFGTELRALLERARAGKALPDDLSGGTFTITNLGMFEIDAFTPIINLPEAAILGVGRIHPKPVVWRGDVTVRNMVALSLAFDHRLVDGAPAARFLQRIKQLIESPFLLLA